MFAKIIVIEPSFVLRQGIVTLLREHFRDFVVEERESHRLIPLLTTSDEDVLFLLPVRLYMKNKELLKDFIKQIVFLSYKEMKLPHINYIKTTEEEFVATIELALGIKAKDIDGTILTESECNVLKNIALGMSNKEIAERLCLSVHTVATHRKNITKKLDIKSVSGLTVYAILHKLVSIREIQA